MRKRDPRLHRGGTNNYSPAPLLEEVELFLGLTMSLLPLVIGIKVLLHELREGTVARDGQLRFDSLTPIGFRQVPVAVIDLRWFLQGKILNNESTLLRGVRRDAQGSHVRRTCVTLGWEIKTPVMMLTMRRGLAVGEARIATAGRRGHVLTFLRDRETLEKRGLGARSRCYGEFLVRWWCTGGCAGRRGFTWTRFIRIEIVWLVRMFHVNGRLFKRLTT